MKYSLDVIEDPLLPRADRLVLFTPMIGITRFARFAGLAGLPAVLPICQCGLVERHAGVQSVQVQLVPGQWRAAVVPADRRAAGTDRPSRARRPAGTLPPVLTFQSVIDFTVSTPAILTALYQRLPDNGSEIVLFDVNRTVKFEPLLRPAAYVALEQLTPSTPQAYRFTSIVNASDESHATAERSIAPGQLQAKDRALTLPYPPGIFSLSHLAIPIPMDDSLYGMQPDTKEPPEFGYHLGAMDARGERGALIVDQDFLTRLSSNPFFPYLLERVDEGIQRPSGPTGRNFTAVATPGIPVRLEAILSTFVSDDTQPFSGP